MPGLREITTQYWFDADCFYALNANGLHALTTAPKLATPHIWIPKLSIPQAVVAGAAATLIRNPTVTRRFWQGWVN